MQKNYGYSQLTVEKADGEKRIITGWASTPDVDRDGDILVPTGARFTAKRFPLLWRHDHSQPVGTVEFGKPTDKGIPFTAHLPDILSPIGLSSRISEAWESVKSGIVSFVSVGFRPLEYSVIEETGGLRFTSWDVLELSLVPVPSNPYATITQVKSFDAEIRASMGSKNKADKARSEVPEKKIKTVKISYYKENKMKISEQLKQFRETLTEKNAKLVELGEKSADSTFDAAQQEEFDTVAAEVEEVKGHIKRLEVAEKAAASTAKPVTQADGASEKAAAEVRQNGVFIKKHENIEKGIGFARLARCKAIAKMESVPAYEIAKGQYGEDSPVYGILKNAVAAGTTTNSTWAAPLVGEESSVFADFVEYLRPQTIIGRMGTNGVPGPTVIPFRTRLITQTSGGEGYWVGEGQAKPLTKFDFVGTTLEPLKVANIAVITMELLRDSSPSAERIVRDQLAQALAARLDIDFLDPGKSPATGVSPASISFGVTPIVSRGTDADAVRCDIQALLQSYAAANNPPTTGVIVMSANLAIALMGMRNALGQREFPDITMGGGTLDGFPVLTSQYLANFGDSTGEYVFMVNAADVYIGDNGGVSVDMSDQASVQMDDTPDNPTTASTVLVSLWQRNLVGFRAERTINWAKRRPTAVAVLSEVNWTACIAS